MSKDSAWNNVVMTFGLGALLGLIQGVVDPRGWLWTTARVLVGALFVVALVLWLVAIVKDRRSRRPHAPET
jgi:hypothetical protein